MVLDSSLVPASEARISSAISAINRSGYMNWPASSTAPILSPSPSTPKPNSSLFSTTELPRSIILLGRVGSAPWLGSVASQSQNKSVCSAPIISSNFTIAGPGTAFPQSTATLTGRVNGPTESTIACKYVSKCGWSTILPWPVSNSPAKKTSFNC